MCSCVCGEGFADGNDLDSHLTDVPETDDQDHYEVTGRGRAPVLMRGRIDSRVAWGIKRLRLERGWKQTRVARLLGCDVSRVSRIERGQCGTPSARIVAELLGTTVGYLLTPCPDCGGQPPRGCQCLRCSARYKDRTGA